MGVLKTFVSIRIARLDIWLPPVTTAPLHGSPRVVIDNDWLSRTRESMHKSENLLSRLDRSRH